MRKVALLITAVIFLIGGLLGYSYYSFQIKFNDKILFRDLSSAKNLLEDWENSFNGRILGNISSIKQNLILEKGWLLAQFGDKESAIKEFRKINEPLAIYNAATLALIQGRDSLDRMADDYVKVLGKTPNDFQAKVNLEIVRILQQRAKKDGSQTSSGDEEGKKNSKIKRYQPGDKDSQEVGGGGGEIRY